MNSLANLLASELTFERYCDRKSEWRCRLRARNGRIIAESGEGYSSLDGCDHGIKLGKAYASTAWIR